MLVYLVAIFLAGFALASSAPASGSDVCTKTETVMAKFFVLNGIVFFTDDADHFDVMRMLNLSSGEVSIPFKAKKLIPALALQVEQAPESVLWAFMYDVNMNQCKLEQVPNADQTDYCTRLSKFKDLVVVRLSSRRVVFLRHNSHKFMLVSDQNNFLELQVLLLHLDKLGFTSSLTFDEQADQFVSTHYGRYGQVCFTSARHQSNRVPLPLLVDILNEHLFETKCVSGPHSYSSVIDLHGLLYGVTSSGLVNQFAEPIDLKENVLIERHSTTDKAFFNCFGNVSATGWFKQDLKGLSNGDIISKRVDSLESMSLDDSVSAHKIEKQTSTSYGGLFIFTFICLLIFGSIGYCYFTEKLGVENCALYPGSGPTEDAFKAECQNKYLVGPSNLESMLNEESKRNVASLYTSVLDGDLNGALVQSDQAGEKTAHKSSDDKVKNALVRVMAKSGLVRTVQSLGKLGRQFGETFAHWRSNMKGPKLPGDLNSGSSQPSGSSELDSLLTEESEKATNGGTELTSPCLDNQFSELSVPFNETSHFLTPRLSTDGDGPGPEYNATCPEAAGSRETFDISPCSPAHLTQTDISLLSPDEFNQSEMSLTDLQRPSQSKATNETMALAQTISSMLDQYKPVLGESSGGSHKTAIISSLSSPSSPILLSQDPLSAKLTKSQLIESGGIANPTSPGN